MSINDQKAAASKSSRGRSSFYQRSEDTTYVSLEAATPNGVGRHVELSEDPADLEIPVWDATNGVWIADCATGGDADTLDGSTKAEIIALASEDTTTPMFATVKDSLSATSGVSSGNLNFVPQTGMTSADYPSWFTVDGSSDIVFGEEGLYICNLFVRATLQAAANSASIEYTLPSSGPWRMVLSGNAGSASVEAMHSIMIWIGPAAVVSGVGGFFSKVSTADTIGAFAYIVDTPITFFISSYTFNGTGPRTFSYDLVVAKVA